MKLPPQLDIYELLAAYCGARKRNVNGKRKVGKARALAAPYGKRKRPPRKAA